MFISWFIQFRISKLVFWHVARWAVGTLGRVEIIGQLNPHEFPFPRPPRSQKGEEAGNLPPGEAVAHIFPLRLHLSILFPRTQITHTGTLHVSIPLQFVKPPFSPARPTPFQSHRQAENAIKLN